MSHSFWKAPVSLLIVLAGLFCLPKSSLAKDKLEVGSFNIQVFGESKVSKPFIRQTLLNIISRYDIIFIQEIRDDKNLAIYELLKELNGLTGKDYHALVSHRMGRGEMKEQYAYFFDSKVVSTVDSYVYKDELDEFAREPYIARFKALGRSFTLAGIHVAPNDVRTELAALRKVQRDVKGRFKDENLFIMGDFNADCIYYKPAHEGFNYFDINPQVLIHDDEDTTVSPNSCAYDRILGFGDILQHTSSGRAFNFMIEYGFDLASSKLISDHYPIEFTITGNGPSLPVTAERPTLEEPSASPGPDYSGDVCGLEPYLTPNSYCYGTFDDSKKRVAESCCKL